MTTEQDAKEKALYLDQAEKAAYGKRKEETNSSKEQQMSNENKTADGKNKETITPSQKKQWVVIQLPGGNIHSFNGKLTIENKEDAKNHATQLSIQHKIPFAVMETVFAVQPKANVDVLNIVD